MVTSKMFITVLLSKKSGCYSLKVTEDRGTILRIGEEQEPELVSAEPTENARHNGYYSRKVE